MSAMNMTGRIDTMAKGIAALSSFAIEVFDNGLSVSGSISTLMRSNKRCGDLQGINIAARTK
ncbi:MAG: hypothetical protein ACI8W7_004389 [Gammaproteobacteria bacterium]|jgi:hypothetical protein